MWGLRFGISSPQGQQGCVTVLHLVSPGVPARRGFPSKQLQAALISEQLHNSVPHLWRFLAVLPDRGLYNAVYAVAYYARVALDGQEANLRVLAGVAA